MVSCLHILLSLFFLIYIDKISIFYPLLPFYYFLIHFRQLLLSPLQLLIPFSHLLSFSLSNPLKWDCIMFFPSCSSSIPTAKQWSLGRRFKGHDLQGPFTNEKKKENERSVYSLIDNSVTAGFILQTLTWNVSIQPRHGIIIFCQGANMPKCVSTFKDQLHHYFKSLHHLKMA